MNLLQGSLKSKNRIIILTASVIMLAIACQKDHYDEREEWGNTTVLTIQKAKKWWNSRNHIIFRSDGDDILTSNNVTPLWDYAIESRYKGEQDIVLVPFKWNNKLIHLGNRGSINLVIYYDHGMERFATKIMGIIAAESYDIPRSQFSVNNFTGYIFQIDESGDVPWIIQTQNGRMTRQARNDLNRETIDFRDPDPSRCYSFSRGFLGRLLRDFASFFEGIGKFVISAILDCYEDEGGGGNNGSDLPPADGPDWPGFGNFGVVNPGPPGNTGPQSGGSFNQYFNNQIFHWTAEHAQLLEQFRVRNNINLPLHVLMLIVNPSCFTNSEMSDVPEDGDETAMYDQCVFWSMLNWMNERASLSPEEYDDLKTNNSKLEDAIAFLLHLEASGFSNGEMESLMDRWFENYGIWDGLSENEDGIICCNPPNTISNGITITYRSAPTTIPSNIVKIGFSTRNRVNPEDIQSGTNGDDRGILLATTPPPGIRPYTDQELFDNMSPLFTATTICDNRTIAFRFIEEFRNNTQTGKLFHWHPLSQKIKDHPVMLNYIKRFGAKLSEELQSTNGVLYSGQINMFNDRPQFNKNCSDRPGKPYDQLHGYQILVNDTETTDIYIIPTSYSYDTATKEWGGYLFLL